MGSAVGNRKSTAGWTAMLVSVPSPGHCLEVHTPWLGMVFIMKDPSLAVKEVKPNGLVAEHNWRGHNLHHSELRAAMETMSRMEAEGLLKACARYNDTSGPATLCRVSGKVRRVGDPCSPGLGYQSPVGVHDGSGENMHEADKHPECPTFMAVVRLI